MGKSTVFSGKNVKSLKKSLSLFDQAYVMADDYDPRTTATEAPPASLFLQYREILQNLSNPVEQFAGNGARSVFGSVRTVALDSVNEVLYVGGNFRSYNGKAVEGLAAIDLTTNDLLSGFNPPSGTFSFKVNEIIFSPSNNRLYVGGLFTTGVQVLDATTGAALPTFTFFSVSGGVECIEYDPSFDILYIGGSFTSVNASVRNRIAAVDGTTGALNTFFYQSPGFNDTVYDIELDSASGFLYCTGQFSSYNSVSVGRLVRLNTADGTISAAFDTSIGLNFGFGDVCKLNDTKTSLYVGGNFGQYTSVTRNHLVKINTADGTLDTSFDGGGAVAGNFFNSNVLGLLIDDAAGFIYVFGTFTESNGVSGVNYITSLSTTDGSLNPSFSSGVGFDSITFGGVLDSSGSNIIVFGNFNFYQGEVDRVIATVNKVNGDRIQSFTSDVGFIGAGSGTVNDIAIDKVNNILYAVGNFTHYKNTPSQGLAAIDLNTKEPLAGFSVGGGISSSILITTVVFDSTLNSLYVGGFSMSTYDSLPISNLIKVNATTGALDTGFVPNITSRVDALVVEGSTNKLYVGGRFTSINAVTRLRVALLDATTGALDLTFDSSTGPSSNVLTLALDSASNKLYLGGSFFDFNFTGKSYLVAVDATTAALDPGFLPSGEPNSSVNSLILDNTNNILYVGGSFTTINSIFAGRVAALNKVDGSNIVAFDASVGFNLNVTDLSISDDKSKLFVCGSFSSYKESSISRVAAINTVDGSLDASFNNGGVFPDDVRSIESHNGTLYASGDFLAYTNLPSEYLVGLPQVALGSQTVGYTDIFVKQDSGSTTNWKSLLGQDVTVVSTDTTLDLVPNQFIAVSGNTTVTLPPMADLSDLKGFKITIKKTDTVATDAIIDGNGFNVDGNSTFTLTQQYESVSLVFSGTEWLVI